MNAVTQGTVDRRKDADEDISQYFADEKTMNEYAMTLIPYVAPFAVIFLCSLIGWYTYIYIYIYIYIPLKNYFLALDTAV